MLTNQSLKISIPLVEVLDSRNIVLQPLPTTPLFNAVSGTNLFQNIGENSASASPLAQDALMSKRDEKADSYYPNLDTITGIVNFLPEGEHATIHDLAIDGTANFIADAVKGHLFKFQNVVIPVIETFTGKVKTYMEAGPKSPLLDMEIKTWAPPAILENAAFQNELGNYRSSILPAALGSKLPLMPDLTEDEIKEAMKTGSAQLDKLIDAWVAERGMTEISAVFSSIFRQSASPVAYLGNAYSDSAVISAALVIFLISQKAIDNPTKGIEVSLATFNTVMAEYRNFTGEWLNHVIDEYEECIKNGQLIKKAARNTLIVHQDVYNKWIEDGGENDVLYGNMLKRTTHYYVADIDAAKEELKKLWVRHENLIKTSLANERYTFFISTLRQVFNEIVREHSNDNLVPITVNDKSYQVLDEIIRLSSEACIEDVYSLIREIVCRCFFANTDANQFLIDMENTMRVNPNLDAREASFIATVKYICRWLAAQVQYVKA